MPSNSLPFMPRVLAIALATALATILASSCAATRQLDTGQTGKTSASLFVPYQFQVQAIDGTVLRDSFYTFDGRDQTLAVAPGGHRLVLRYFDLIRDDGGSDDYARVLSPPIRIDFKAEAGGRYAVIGKHPATPAAGRAFAQQPTLAIEARDSGTAVSGPVTLAPPENDTGQLRADEDTPMPGEGAAEAVRGAAGSSGAARIQGAAAADARPQSYQMLKYWWNNAPADVRERFDAWRRGPAAE